MVCGVADVRFADAKKGIDTTIPTMLVTPITDEAVPVDWERAVEVALTPSDLESTSASSAGFAPLPAVAGKAKSYDGWRKDFAAWLFRASSFKILTSPRLKAFSQPGESEADFRARIGHTGREKRDQELEKLRRKYAAKISSLQERIRRAEQAVERESEQVTQSGVQVAISFGATLLGAMFGRKAVSATTLGRATTAARGAGRVMKERQDVDRAKENVEAYKQELAHLDAQMKQEADTLAAAADLSSEPLETVNVRPTKQNVTVKLLALAWAPAWQDGQGHITDAWR